MKQIKGVFGALVCVIALSACQKKDDGGNSANQGGGVVASTPQTACNLPSRQGDSVNCNPEQYRNYGWQPLPYQWNYGQNFCGCPVGTRPVYTTNYGFGCAPNNVYYDAYNQYPNQVFNYWNQNTHYNNIPQISYAPLISGDSQNCYQQAAQACDSREANSCGSNGYCRVVGGGSVLGICTYDYGVDNYGSSYPYQYSCRYYNEGLINGYYCFYTHSSTGFSNSSR